MVERPHFDTAPSLLITGGGGLAEIAESARLAEQAGFASAWTTEFYDRSGMPWV